MTGQTEWMRPSQVAVRWGCNRATVHVWAERFGVRTKVMPPPRRERRYHAADVESLGQRLDAGEFGEQE